MTTTLGAQLVEAANLRIERYGVPAAALALVDDAVPALGSSQTLTVGDLPMTGVMVTGGDFGGQILLHWCAGAGGLDANGNGVSAWAMPIPSRPYHDDNGIMLSVVLADLERDAAVACGAAPLGTSLEVPDVRLDVAGSWIRPAAIARDLLDALAAAAGQPRGAWWIANDGSTHLGPRPASKASPLDLTVGGYDAGLLRATVALAGDGVSALMPGTVLSNPGLPAPLTIATLIVHVEGGDIGAELWGEASNAELFARIIQHVMAPTVGYLAAQPASVTGVANDGRVAISATPPGSPFPDAPLLGHAPGIPGASFTMAPGAAVVVVCLGGSPGAPVCVAYPGSMLPVSVVVDASTTWSVGQGAGPLVKDGPLQSWVTALTNALSPHGITVPALTGEATTKLMGE